jgi:hypothetical protein
MMAAPMPAPTVYPIRMGSWENEISPFSSVSGLAIKIGWGRPIKLVIVAKPNLACELYAPSAQRLGRLDFKNKNKPRPDCLSMPGRVMVISDQDWQL